MAEASGAQALVQRSVGAGDRFAREASARGRHAAGVAGSAARSSARSSAAASPVVAPSTVKTYKRRDGHVWLLPHNEAYTPIHGDRAVILGRVVTVLRKI